jgi:hypothetical protein
MFLLRPPFRLGVGRRCETGQGEGFVCVELLFLPSVYALPDVQGRALRCQIARNKIRRCPGDDGRCRFRVLRR